MTAALLTLLALLYCVATAGWIDNVRRGRCASALPVTEPIGADECGVCESTDARGGLPMSPCPEMQKDAGHANWTTHCVAADDNVRRGREEE